MNPSISLSICSLLLLSLLGCKGELPLSITLDPPRGLGDALLLTDRHGSSITRLNYGYLPPGSDLPAHGLINFEFLRTQNPKYTSDDVREQIISSVTHQLSFGEMSIKSLEAHKERLLQSADTVTGLTERAALGMSIASIEKNIRRYEVQQAWADTATAADIADLISVTAIGVNVPISEISAFRAAARR